MSSSKKNTLLQTILTSNIAGCSCSCSKSKLSDVYEPTQKPKTQIHKNPIPQPRSVHKSDTSFIVDDDDDEDQCTSTTISFNNNSSSQPSDSAGSTNPKNTKLPSPTTCTKVNDSIAVVKESNDPYQDFRHSMLQMIVEKQIYSKEDLQEMLSCFLELNSTDHHDVIIQAFAQIWNDLLTDSKKPLM